MNKFKASASVEWTVLLYIGAVENGQDTVDAMLIDQIVGAAIKGSSADCVYQFARADRTIRGAIRGDGRNEILASGPRVGITNPEHLTDFVDWATRHFPSRYTALFLKDHGSGWAAPQTPERRKRQLPKGLGGLGIFYDGTKDSYMSTADVSAAIERSEAKHVDIYGFDACEMGAVEVGYEIRNVADFMIATEAWESSSGWPYSKILAHLRGHEGPIGPREVTREVVRLARHGTPAFELVGLELAWMTFFAKNMDVLGSALVKNIDAVSEWMARRSDAASTQDVAKLLKDLVGEAQRQGAGWSDVGAAANTALEDLALACPAKGSGLSIFLPARAGSNDIASYGAVSFARNNHWTAFLSALNVELLGRNRASSAPLAGAVGK